MLYRAVLRRRFWVVAFAFGPVVAASAEGDDTHFFGTVSGTAVFQGAGPEFYGAGTFSYLGASTNLGSAQLLAFPPIPLEECGGGPGIPNINTEILTAANGDQIVMEMNDVACVFGPNVFVGFGEWTVLSGTGRFAAATGSGVMAGFVDFNVAFFEFKLTGQIENIGQTD